MQGSKRVFIMILQLLHSDFKSELLQLAISSTMYKTRMTLYCSNSRTMARLAITLTSIQLYFLFYYQIILQKSSF